MAEPGASHNVAAALDSVAAYRPDGPAIVALHPRRPPLTVTFRELLGHSDALARGLGYYGIERGMRAVVMVTPGPDFFALVFGLFRAGIVPVMIDPGMDRRNLRTCIDETEPHAFIGIPRAQVARLALGWGKATISHLVMVGPRLGWGGVSLAQVRQAGRSDKPFTAADVQPDEVAAILFTSGSTGIAKGAVYTHANFASQIALIKATYGIQPGEVDLPTFLPFALFDPALGVTAVLPPMDFARPGSVDPEVIVRAARQYQPTNMFGSPALLDRVSRYGVAHGITLPSLRRVISAGAPVPGEVIERFAQMLGPEAEIYTPYGATEVLPVASIGSRDLLRPEIRDAPANGKGVCIGRPVPDTEVHIITIDDNPIARWDPALVLPTGEIGEIVVSSPSVTQSYCNRPQATALAKIEGPPGTIRHRMGDLGYFDPEGRLWFCGRKSHRVALGEATLYSIPVERVFTAHPAVYRAALVKVEMAGRPEPVVCIELEESHRTADKAMILEELALLGARHDHTRVITRFLFHPRFPVDIRHNAKIFREKLAVWAQQEMQRFP